MSDVLTTEIEHVNVSTLAELASSGHVVHPDSSTLKTIQDKFHQKVYLRDRDVPVADFLEVQNIHDAEEAGRRFGYPFVLKNRKLAYDGRGNAVINTASELTVQFTRLGEVGLYAERLVPFAKELALMVVRSNEGIATYPIVETVQQNAVCHLVIAPANVSPSVERTALEVARSAIECFSGLGVYGVEMFLLHDDSVLVNEIAPRFALIHTFFCCSKFRLH